MGVKEKFGKIIAEEKSGWEKEGRTQETGPKSLNGSPFREKNRRATR